MEMRNHIKLLALASVSLGLAGCLGEGKTIDRTQPNALDKSMFEGVWYYRAAVVEADRESGAVEGITGNMDKLRWEIREKLLVGYRSYEYAPYTEGLTDEGRDFFGAPVVAYKILSHFDIQRQYDDATGVQSNVIVENTTDRPWYQRQYIRVDWSWNTVGTPTRFWTGWTAYPDAFFSATALAGYYEQGQEETNIFRPYLTQDYFDITNNYSVAPEPYFCQMMLLFNSVPRCGAGTVKVRLSFRKVDPNDDYEALYYPDELDLTDDDGNAIILNGDGRACGPNRDPGECTARSYPMDAQFGNFRILRVAFDKERYFTRSGRIYLAGRFDIWNDSYDESGSLIPHEQRTAHPIVYWNSVKMPAEMQEVTKRMAADWTVPFDETVAFLQNKTVDQVRQDLSAQGGQMFQMRENSCNPAGIVEYAADNGLMDVVDRIAGNRDRVTRGNVEQVCAAVQFAELEAGKTLDPKVAESTGAELAFTWQRKGDLRYNINNYVNQLMNGPWGVAQFGQDPETGEFVANQANYFSDAGDLISQRSVDQLQWYNGDLSEAELFRGDFTRDGVISRRGVKNASIRSAVRDMWMAYESEIIDSAGDSLAPETVVGAEDQRMRRMWSGTEVEKDLFVTDDILRTFAGPTLYQPFDAGRPTSGGAPVSIAPGTVSAEALAAASPVNWGMTPETNPYNEAAYELGRRAWDMADFFDPNVSGLAEHVKGWDRQRIWDYLRRELYLAVQTHEVGHTVGLRHNFQASMDPMNYHHEFWGKPYVNEDGDTIEGEFWKNKPTPEDPSNRGPEFKYASIMDYGFDIPQEGLHGIGEYDKAAIRFQYGQLMHVWDNEKVAIPDPRKYGSFARRCGQDTPFFGLEGMLYWNTPELYPKLFMAPTDEEKSGACDGNYDGDQSCDSDLDRLYRQLVVDIQSNAAANDDKSNCQLFIADLEDLLAEVGDLDNSNPKLIYEARKLVRVQDFLEQERTVLTNFPEYDNPATPQDESNDGVDDDNDGVVDDKGGVYSADGTSSGYSEIMHRVDYAYCSDRFAGFSNPYCQRWDAGWDFQESVQSHRMKFERDYVFSNFRRDSIAPWGNPWAYVSRLLSRRFFHMSSVYRFYLYTRESTFQNPRYLDWAEAAYEGINFLEKVLQTPEPGTYCLGNDNVYRAQVDPNAACNQPYTVGIGPGEGRYLDNSWTDEYFYKANRIGDYYAKLAAIFQLTSSSGYFARDLSDQFDRRAFSLGYLRVYQDPLLQRFSSLISGDHTGYRSRVVEEDGDRFVRYMPFFDEEEEVGTGENRTVRAVRAYLTKDEDRDGVEDFPAIEPSWSYSLQYYSLAFALGNWSSVVDYAPEYYRMAKISIAGTPEDVIYPDEVDLEVFTDPETKITYRAPIIKPVAAGGILAQEFHAYYGDARMASRGIYRNWSAGSDVLAEANTFVTNEYTPAREACENSGDASDCARYERARNGLSERIGFIDQLRKINRRAEMAWQ